MADGTITQNSSLACNGIVGEKYKAESLSRVRWVTEMQKPYALFGGRT